MPTHIEVAIAHVEWSHAEFLRMIADWPADKMTAQLPGAPNHPLWTLGHLATANQWFAGHLDGKPKSADETWEKRFGMNSTPTTDASAYPAIAVVRGECDQSLARLVAAAKATSEQDAFKPTINESYGFCSSRVNALQVCAWHIAWHMGQVSMLRRGLGFKSIYE
jgi:uncharacterized damage-inducible protein DinB